MEIPANTQRKRKSCKDNNTCFNETEVKLAVSMIEMLQNTLDVMYFLLENERIDSLVLVLISGEKVDIQTIVNQEKRDTDILFPVDRTRNLYAVICQGTEVHGGFIFANRIVKNAVFDKGLSVYCAVLEFKTTKYPSKEIIFRLLEEYINAKSENKHGEVIFKALT